jgi:pantetheine-phosphate adenylyltransferase
MFDGVIVSIAKSVDKKPMFDLETRIKMVEASLDGCCNVEVVGFEGLLVELAKKHSVNVLIRGLRAVSDFEYELQMGYANASLDPSVETVYLMPSLENAFISSSVVRSILKHHGDISHLVPKQTLQFLEK